MHSEAFLRLVDSVGASAAVIAVDKPELWVNYNQFDLDFIAKHRASAVAVAELERTAHNHFAQTKDPA